MDVVSRIIDLKAFENNRKMWIYRANAQEVEGIAQLMGVVYFESEPKEYDIDILQTCFNKLFEDINFSGEYTQISDFFWNVKDCIKKINLSVSEGCKASLGMLLTYKNSYFVFNIGNIRIYKVDNSDIKILTNEHNKAEELFKAGIIGKSNYFDNNKHQELTKYIGMRSEDQLVDISRADNLQPGVTFVICNSPIYTNIDSEDLYKFTTSESESDIDNIVEYITAHDDYGIQIIKIEEVGEKKPIPQYKKTLNKAFKSIVVLMASIGLIFGGYKILAHIKATVIPNKIIEQIDNSETEKEESEVIESEQDLNVTDMAIVIETESNTTEPAIAESDDKNKEEVKEEVKEETVTETKKEEPKEAEYTIYEIQKGETLYQVSRKFFGDDKHVNEIIKLNGIKDASSVPVGYKLKIPKK